MLHTTQIYFLADLEVRNPIQSHRAPVKVWAGLAPSGGSEGESVPLPFSSWGRLHSLAHNLLLESLQSRAYHHIYFIH